MDRKNKGSEKYTIMVVPDAHSEVQSYRFPRWVFHGLVVVFFISLAVFGYLALSYGAYKVTKAENEKLKLINSTQAVEIRDLEKITTEVLTKLEDIVETDAKIRELVGLKENEEKPQGGATLSSRSISILSTSYDFNVFNSAENIQTTWDKVLVQKENQTLVANQKNTDIDATVEVVKENLNKINNLLEEQEKALDRLETDVIKRLEFLDAVPDSWPLRGRITSEFGWRRNPFNRRVMEYHEGLDIAAPYGTAIRAAGGGRVTFAGWKPIYGNTVVINHGYGYVSQYAHNSTITVKVGQEVNRGDIIARVGSTGRSTGPHLDFRIAYNGKWIDPLKVLK